jgi:16S rRNA (guanine966-N2)-methyltransferase
MRIVAGRHKGRALLAPPGEEVRPTSDRAREALFNILAHARFAGVEASPVAEARVLDAFAGTGALALEALSRGAAHAILMDRSSTALAVARVNIGRLGEELRTTVLTADATAPPPPPSDPRRAPATLVFLDPPYRSGLAAPALTALADRGWIAEGALVVVETELRAPFDLPSGFALVDQRRYGKAAIRFLIKGETASV